VILRSTGGSLLIVESVRTEGDFVATSACTLMASEHCTVSVRFTPKSIGPTSGRLSISGGPLGTERVALSGTGLPNGPVLAVDPPSVGCGAERVGQSSSIRMVTVSNGGDSELALGDMETSGDFSSASQCGPAVPVGGRCQIGIVFTPSVSGTRTGTLTVADA